jgi:hypothetical protein
MDPARVPAILVRNLGAGEIAVAQIGRWSTPAQPDMESVKKQLSESLLTKSSPMC